MNYTFVFIRYSSREEAMKVVELENNKRMDDLYVKVFMGGKPKREDNWRIEDLSLSDYHQVVVLIPKAVENDYNVHKSGDLNPRDKIEDIHVEPSWLSFLDDNPKGNNNLIDVPVSIEAFVLEPGFVALVGTLCPSNLKCLLVNVYALKDCLKRNEVFSAINSMVARVNVPILLGGGFNIMRCPNEKMGVSIPKRAMATFSNFIDALDLIDLPLHGGMQQILSRGLSDHNPTYISISIDQWGPKPFKWFDHWFEENELMDKMEASRGSFKGMGITPVLRQCKTITKEWEKCNRTRDSDSIQAIENKCQAIENEISKGGNTQSKSIELKQL
ncbi:hypothetical protein V6N13_108325 [Hibiscus sabdariffa]